MAEGKGGEALALEATGNASKPKAPARQYFSSVIFSRFPLIDTEVVVYPRPSAPEVLLRADINFNGDTIRIFTTHLQSVHFIKGDYEKIDKIKNYEDGIVSNSRTNFSKLKRGIVYRSLQTNVIKEKLEQSKYPDIFCGDFNDVPNSYTYFHIRKVKAIGKRPPNSEALRSSLRHRSH